MADETRFTSPLNFNDSLIGKSINDRKVGLNIVFGYVSGLDTEAYELLYHNKGIGIALTDCGIGQKELDRACQKLSGDCRVEDFEILITKSDLPFDSRWYLIGDLRKLMELAEKDRIALPFSKHLTNSVYDELY